MTARQAATHKAKDCHWFMSRRGTMMAGFARVADGWTWQGESTDGHEWLVKLNDRGALVQAKKV